MRINQEGLLNFLKNEVLKGKNTKEVSKLITDKVLSVCDNENEAMALFDVILRLITLNSNSSKKLEQRSLF